jgi:hypothetical protein
MLPFAGSGQVSVGRGEVLVLQLSPGFSSPVSTGSSPGADHKHRNSACESSPSHPPIVNQHRKLSILCAPRTCHPSSDYTPTSYGYLAAKTWGVCSRSSSHAPAQGRRCPAKKNNRPSVLSPHRRRSPFAIFEVARRASMHWSQPIKRKERPNRRRQLTRRPTHQCFPAQTLRTACMGR